MQITAIGLDIAKNVFQVHGIDGDEQVVVRNVGRRFSVLDSVYGVVLALALWMTIDLDYPGIGLIRVSNLPVVETLAAMN